MIEAWKQILTTKAAEWDLPGGGEWNFLFHNNYHPNISTINLLWFYRNESFPRVVTKLKRERDALALEFHNLKSVYSVAPRHVPRPIHLGDSGEFGMLWMGGVPGYCIPPGGRDLAPNLAPSVDMLVSIQRALNRGIGQAAADRHARMVEAPVALALRQTESKAVRDGCLALLAAATPEWLAKLPVIPQHGDLYLDNVLRYQDQRHIIDWEDFGKVDLPFYDLLTLLHSSLSATAHKPEHWDPSVKQQIVPLLERYSRGVPAPSAAIRLLLPLTLANRLYYHCGEGRAAAAAIVSAGIEHYFEHTSYWQEVFIGG
jgi:hypothetical protein